MDNIFEEQRIRLTPSEDISRVFDNGNELRIISSVTVRTLVLIAGILSLVLGVIGIFLPLLPTTPFLLLTAFCFSRSSQTFHDKLMNNKYLGEPIRNWQRTRTIPLKAKKLAIIMIAISIGYSNLFIIPMLPGQILTAAFAIFMVIYIYRIPETSKVTEQQFT